MDVIAATSWRTKAIADLTASFERLQSCSIQSLFASEPERPTHFSLSGPYLYADFSKHAIDAVSWRQLEQYAMGMQLEKALERLSTGHPVNVTEKQPALHNLYRASKAPTPSLQADWETILQSRREEQAFIDAVNTKNYRDIVHIGVGGSYLGPKCLYDALAPEHGDTLKHRLHFIANLDAKDAEDVLSQCDPNRTLFLVVSKSWTTQETRYNLQRAKQWLEKAGVSSTERFVAITARPDRLANSPVSFWRYFILPNWLGGRYSVWSSVSLGVKLVLGTDVFDNFLKGGEEMDAHCRENPILQTLPVKLALVNFWYSLSPRISARSLLMYSHRLRGFPEYCQQLEMESNGKRWDIDGYPVETQTAPLLLSAPETLSQHSFHQLFHQGTHCLPVECILPFTGAESLPMAANALAQTHALLVGQPGSTQKDRLLGNRPSTLLLLKGISPQSLGALIALYEYQVYYAACLWQINPFDQPGVEFGKQLAGPMLAALEGSTESPDFDASTQAAIQTLHSWMEMPDDPTKQPHGQ